MKTTDLILLALAGVAAFLVVKGVSAKPAQAAAQTTFIPPGGVTFAPPEMSPQLFTPLFGIMDPSLYPPVQDSFFKP